MMITRLVVALLALSLVSGGGRNGNGLAPESGPLAGSDPPSAQAGLAKQALDFCLTHRKTCAEAAGSVVKSAGSLPSPASVRPAPPAGLQAAAPGEPAPHLPLPPRRRSTPAGA
ncbi:MAG: hypothetical protein IOB85_03740 [Methylobacterium sp.]|nr:hypothetical protein [Methylobacterium sp.]MCA3657441.1 hypothetical protein [Methylobacterium sp.]MCA3661006.1 hypothetical protein [Methylobacterium sp.]MCA3662727.1 hypothetical protein [Methylobacterium sp.]MCA3667201.1 hypothetical protein [Methylobacterium sp.]